MVEESSNVVSRLRVHQSDDDEYGLLVPLVNDLRGADGATNEHEQAGATPKAQRVRDAATADYAVRRRGGYSGVRSQRGKQKPR